MPSDPTCPGVLRISDTGTDTCSLGRHCEAIEQRARTAAYRAAHPRVSETSGTVVATGATTGAATASSLGVPWAEPHEDRTLFELFADAMARLERINPPGE